MTDHDSEQPVEGAARVADDVAAATDKVVADAVASAEPLGTDLAKEATPADDGLESTELQTTEQTEDLVHQAGAEATDKVDNATVVEGEAAQAVAEADIDAADEGASGVADQSARQPTGERPAITAPTDLGDVPDVMSADDFATAVEKTVFEFKEGDIVAGRVVRVDPDEVLVDIGYKSEGVVPAYELSILNNANPEDVVEVGEAIETLVLQMEDDDGRLVLSKKRAQYERAWGRIERIMNEGGTVEGSVIEVVKGGLIVDIGLRGFLPASLVDLRRVRDLQPFVGETIETKVIELDKNRNNVVLSRRAFLEENQAEQRQGFLADLQPGDILDGVVSSVVNFGAFIDLGGMDGLVHVSELSWQHVSHPGEVVTVGDKVKIRVLEVDRELERISLSIRQTRDDPWDGFASGVTAGSIVEGKVTKTVPFGAFVSVDKGVEGLVHVSEIAMHHVDSPELELSINQEVRVKVTEIDADRRRVSLSIKQALPEWEDRPTWSEKPAKESRPKRREFAREPDAKTEPAFSADSSLEAILAELKERGIGRS